MCHQGHQSCIPEPNPEADQSAMELVGYQTSRKEIWDVYHSIYLLQRYPRSPSCRDREGEGLYRIYSPPDRPGYSGRPTLLKPRVQVPMGERGLEPSHCNLMRQCYGLPARKPWRLPRPSMMILRGTTMNIEKGHEPTARVGVDPGAIREVVLEAV